jgi:hypothetical protein
MADEKFPKWHCCEANSWGRSPDGGLAEGFSETPAFRIGAEYEPHLVVYSRATAVAPGDFEILFHDGDREHEIVCKSLPQMLQKLHILIPVIEAVARSRERKEQEDHRFCHPGQRDLDCPVCADLEDWRRR